MNNLIVRKIKEARLERGLTQKDMANHLGRTSAAISDMERGKVQVSASDLFSISQFLNKPIEFFFGQDFGSPEIQDMIAFYRKQGIKGQSNSIELSKMMIRMFELGDFAKSIPEGESLPTETIQEFYEIFIPFSKTINQIAKTLNEYKEKFDAEIRLRSNDKEIN